MRQTIELDSVPTVLHVPQGLGDKLICGFADGKIIMYRIGHLGAEGDFKTQFSVEITVYKSPTDLH